MEVSSASGAVRRAAPHPPGPRRGTERPPRAGVGEAEALGELFFDNLATLLSVTDLMLGFFLNVLILALREPLVQQHLHLNYSPLVASLCLEVG